jgi:hypothetical protein
MRSRPGAGRTSAGFPGAPSAETDRPLVRYVLKNRPLNEEHMVTGTRAAEVAWMRIAAYLSSRHNSDIRSRPQTLDGPRRRKSG